MNVIGRRIKQKREQLGFSQDNLALELGITQPTYARLEKEDNRISIPRLINIAAILKTSVSSLIDEKEISVSDEQNIEVLNAYEAKKIVTACPHCFNTLKNEYPELGGKYEVVHHTEFLKSLLDDGRLTIEGGQFKGKKITFHDPCYLGRANNVYEAPRELILKLDAELVEMKRSKANGLCCGAGGAQMFKDAESGNKEVNIERTEEALETKSDIIAAGCPFCNTMMTDGIKNKEKEGDVKVMDIAELIANAQDL